MERWIIAVFAILGAFFTCAFGGAVIAELVGFWELPPTGFSAAFVVVSLAYIAVPSGKSVTTIFVFLLGGVLAWVFLEPSYYPGTYPDRAYQKTHLPFIASMIGGVIPLAIVLLPTEGFRTRPNPALNQKQKG